MSRSIKFAVVTLNLIVIFGNPADTLAQQKEVYRKRVFVENLLKEENASPVMDLSIQPSLPAPANDETDEELVIPMAKSVDGYRQVTYAGSGVIHKRLIFEEFNLERKGISRREIPQVFESGIKFFTKGLLFPAAFPTKRMRACESCGKWWWPQ